MNKVMLIGRLGRDPELKYAQSGTPITNFSIATDESYIDKDGNKVQKAEWHSIVTFQRVAENCANYLVKGSLVFVEGSLQTRKWQDQQGQDRYTTEVKAQRVLFLDKRNQGGGDDGGQNAPHQNSGQGQYGGQSRNQNQAPRQNQNQSQNRNNAQNGQWDRNGGGNQGGGNQNWNGNQNQGYGNHAEDLGPAFPSEAAGMDDVPF